MIVSNFLWHLGVFIKNVECQKKKNERKKKKKDQSLKRIYNFQRLYEF